MAPDSITNLEKVLQEQVEMYEKYALLLKADTDLMSKMKVDELERNNKTKSTLLLKIQAMDQGRQNLVKQIAREYGIAEENVKMTDICNKLGGHRSTQLLKLREKLQNAMNSLKTLQRDTTLIAQSSLAWINSSMATLRGLLTPAGTYNPQGKVDHPQAFSGRTVERQA